MSEQTFPLELVSNFISILILLALFYKYYQYKQKLDILRKFKVLKDEDKLSNEDKIFLDTNLEEYKIEHVKTKAFIKFLYPIFITAAAILVFLFSFSTALIHLNIAIVIFIYFHVKRIHARNFIALLEDINS